MNNIGISHICDNNCSISDLSISIYTNDIITRKTIRSKGQFLTQRFFYMKGGTVDFVLNETNAITCTAGDLLYLPPDVTYTCYWQDNPENSFILIMFNLHSETESLLLSDNMFVVEHDKHKTYLKEFTMLANYYLEGGLGYKLKCQSIFFDIIYSLIPKLIEFPNMPKKSEIYKGILYIENNYIQKIDISQIAKMCSLCPSAFRKQFHAIIGMSPMEYKNYLICKKAAELLKTGEFSVSEVALMVGIDDIYYFNKMFKKYFLITPGKYKSTQATT